MDRRNPFKSFGFNELDGLGDPENPEGILGEAFGIPPGKPGELDHETRTKILNSVEALKSEVRPNQRIHVAKLSWRCLKCNTVNGLHLSSKVTVRKTCKRCARPRNNPLTVLQELHELNREQFILEWMEANPELTLEEANKYFDDSSRKYIEEVN